MTATTSTVRTVPGAGHSVNTTRREAVDEALLRLPDRAVEQRAA